MVVPKKTGCTLGNIVGVLAKTDCTGAEATGFCATTEGVIAGAGLVVAYLVPSVLTDGSATMTGFVVVATCCIWSYVRVVGVTGCGYRRRAWSLCITQRCGHWLSLSCLFPSRFGSVSVLSYRCLDCVCDS